jgi:hypothetical protein
VAGSFEGGRGMTKRTCRFVNFKMISIIGLLVIQDLTCDTFRAHIFKQEYSYVVKM